MPLRDHFHFPLLGVASWEEVHGGWPMVIVQHLFGILPKGYVAAPRVHLGSEMEIDVAAYERSSDSRAAHVDREQGQADAATAIAAPPAPTLEIGGLIPDQDEYEVRIYDATQNRTLVAVIELVSPGNKDRPVNRRAFAAKCAALLQKDVSVSIVDLVTARNFSLYAELLEMIGRSDLVDSANATPIYAVTCRARKLGGAPRTAVWAYPLAVGKALPKLQVWLTEELPILVDLETTYEDTCRVLMIP